MSIFSALDQPSLLGFLFYPRRDLSPPPEGAFDMMVEVEENVRVACRVYLHAKSKKWILYFHGNGEVAGDYDEIAPFYLEKGLNLVVADYRGYGKSEGVPTFSSLVEDAHRVFHAVQEEVRNRSDQAELWVMGRSMGSMPALELASSYSQELMGLIVESGFSSPIRLINHLGLPLRGAGLDEVENESQRKAASVIIPALLIHGERDRLVPFEEAEVLLKRLGTDQKELVVLPYASHNDIMFVDQKLYFDSIEKFTH